MLYFLIPGTYTILQPNIIFVVKGSMCLIPILSVSDLLFDMPKRKARINKPYVTSDSLSKKPY